MPTAASPYPLAGEGEIDASPETRKRRLFPGWRWVTVAVAFPIAGYIGWGLGGRVDAVDAALVGGALTGAGIGTVQWWAADGALGRPAAWVAAGSILFMLLSGLLLARFAPTRTQAPQ